MWDTFWAAVQAPLLAIVTAVATWLGVVITAKVKEFLGERTSMAVNVVYQTAVDQAVGWLNNALGGTAPPSLTTGDTMVDSAVAYVRNSYPKLDKIEPDDMKLAEDIIAGFGKAILGKKG